MTILKGYLKNKEEIIKEINESVKFKAGDKVFVFRYSLLSPVIREIEGVSIVSNFNTNDLESIKVQYLLKKKVNDNGVFDRTCIQSNCRKYDPEIDQSIKDYNKKLKDYFNNKT